MTAVVLPCVMIGVMSAAIVRRHSPLMDSAPPSGVTAGLSREHEIVLAELDALLGAVERSDAPRVERTLLFFDQVLPLHRRKEELVLFPALARVPALAAGPLPCMLADHEEEAKLVAGLRAAAVCHALPVEGWETIRAFAGRLAGHLRAHIRKEDGVLFPIADQLIRGHHAATVTQAMDRIGWMRPGEPPGPLAE